MPDMGQEINPGQEVFLSGSSAELTWGEQGMARRKKQKGKAAGKAAPQSINVSDTVAGIYGNENRQEETGSPALPIKKPSSQKETATPRSSGQRPGMRLPTAVAGMFLTFILGLYLGSLLPEIINEARVEPQAENKAPVPAEPKGQEEKSELGHLIDKLRERAAAHPDDALAWIELGNAYFDSSQPALAISAYEKALKIVPENADVLTDLGIMYRENGNPLKALECFRKAAVINPAHQNAMFNEGVVLAMDLRDTKGAIEAWGRLLELNPNAKAPDGRSLGEMINNLKQ